jgi:hypothetical protein
VAVILSTQEVEIRRIETSPGKIVCEILSEKREKKSHKWVGGVAQSVGPEFKSQYHQKNWYGVGAGGSHL